MHSHLIVRRLVSLTTLTASIMIGMLGTAASSAADTRGYSAPIRESSNTIELRDAVGHIAVPTVLAQPVLRIAARHGRSVRVEWDAVPGATRYHVSERSWVGSRVFRDIGHLVRADAGIVPSIVLNAGNREYWTMVTVTAISGNGESAPSKGLEFT